MIQLELLLLNVSKRGTQVLVHGLLSTEHSTGMSEVMKCEDFSSLDCLLSVTALVVKFGQILLSKIRLPADSPSLDETRKCENIVDHIDAQRTVVGDPKIKHQLDLFKDDDGIWRSNGRIQNADVPYAAKHPILLPRSHHFTTLVVQKAHQRVGHNGAKETLTELCSKFWIIKGRSLVKKIIHSCRLSRRFEGQPYSSPLPPPLPSFRLEEAPPFSFTGIDFAGPL